MIFTDQTWYAVVSKPNSEKGALEQLRKQGYGTFLPMCLVRKSHAGKADLVQRPLFPRYLFVGLDSGQPFRPILNTPGVAHVLRDACGNATRIPAGVLQRIWDRCDRDGGVVNLVPEVRTMRWASGQRLKIVEGPLSGLEGLFVASSKERVRVLIELFGRSSEAELPIDAIEAVKSSA